MHQRCGRSTFDFRDGEIHTDTRFIYDVGLPDQSINDRCFLNNFGFGADLRWLAHSGGIDVLMHADVKIHSRLAVRTEPMFRDPPFYFNNKFDQSSVTFGGVRFLLDQTPTKTLVDFNGIMYGLGLVFTLQHVIFEHSPSNLSLTSFERPVRHSITVCN